MHMLYWNIQHSFQNIPKKMASATICYCDTNAVISLILLLMKIIIMIRGKKHYQATNHKIDSLLWEMYQRLLGNVKMSNKKGDVPAVHLYIWR